MYEFYFMLVFLHSMEGASQKSDNPKKAVRLEGLYTIFTKGRKLWSSDQTKPRDLGS